jgi:ribosomal protein L11 methyltransferase
MPSAEHASDSDGTSAEGTWIELSVTADIEAVDAVSEIIGRVAAGGTSVEPAFVLVDEGLSAAVDPSRPAIVRGYLPASDPRVVEAAVAETTTALGHLQAFGLRPIGDLETRPVLEADWAAAWKEHFPVLRVGRRLVIRPTWRRHRRAADDVVIALDPGMAFGTGLHPTTRLCLTALERVADNAATGGAGLGRVLDVGTGSGILAIAAGLLGASPIFAVDPDPIAIDAATANAARNGLAARVEVRRGSVPTSLPPFDLVVANLIASLLIDLAPALAAEVRPRGNLIASGIYVDREGDVSAALAAVGLGTAGRDAEGDWVALTAVRDR